MERWKKVVNFEDFYEVSDEGRIRNIKTGRVLKGSVHSSGYIYVTFNIGNNVYSNRVHRLVALAFLSKKKSSDEVVNHKNGNKKDNSLANLEWMSHKENAIHSRKTGLNKTKLSREDVYLIRERFETGVNNKKELARLFGVTESNINSVVKKKTFKYLS